MTQGVVSAVATGKEIEKSVRLPHAKGHDLRWIQHDAAISPGNSGGPLCDFHGRVLGLNTFIFKAASGAYFATTGPELLATIRRSGKVQELASLPRETDETDQPAEITPDDLEERILKDPAAVLVELSKLRRDAFRPLKVLDAELGTFLETLLTGVEIGEVSYLRALENRTARDIGGDVYVAYLGLIYKVDQLIDKHHERLMEPFKKGLADADGEVAWVSACVIHRLHRRRTTSQFQEELIAFLRTRPGPASQRMLAWYPTVAKPAPAAALPRTLQSTATGLEMVLIEPGDFVMGSPETEKGRGNDEAQRTVRIARPFYAGKYELTQGEFERVMGFNPSSFSRTGGEAKKVTGKDPARFPVEVVSWFDTVAFCNGLSDLDGLPISYRLSRIQRDGRSIKRADVAFEGGRGYRLLTDEEWEYACRAGTTTPFHFGDVNDGRAANVDGYTPYGTKETGPRLGRPTTVGSYPPNRFGLHDMHGNVWEWCEDTYAEKLTGGTNPLVSDGGSYRVRRGGGWTSRAASCRSASRFRLSPSNRRDDLGFRVTLSSDQ